MSDKIDMHKVKELKEMLENRKPNEPVDKILTVFCERHSISLATCRVFYKQMVEKGEVKEQ
ncbi:MAG: hypothetical protein ACXV2C_03465 [Candidatus Bathyarchaeia archaeon]